MTDYLYSVKKLVERLDLHPGDTRFQRNKREGRAKDDSVSDMAISENYSDVIYRHRKHSKGKDLFEVSKTRKKNRGDVFSMSSALPNRRESVSLYQLIKSNQEKCHRKNSTRCALNVSTAKLATETSALDKKYTFFQYHVESTKTGNDVGACAHVSDPSVGQKYSLRGSATSFNSSLLSPITPIHIERGSPKGHGDSDWTFCRNRSCSGTLKSPNPDLKSPLCLDPVFSENPTFSSCRKNSGTFRLRLSVSKSVPLSPPAANAEKTAQQNGDFQLKLDTLRAELLAMRKADQELARRLLALYTEIQVLKVKNSCMNYSELLDEAYYEAEMADEVPDMCDAPQKFSNKLLTSHGVTSFNIHSRRFSCS